MEGWTFFYVAKSDVVGRVTYIYVRSHINPDQILEKELVHGWPNCLVLY